MNNIKMLYNKAKYEKTISAISEYNEAIKEYLESPYDYITNIEYIISSSIGIQTFKEFLSRYDIPICTYDYLIENFNKCIDKCKKANLDSSIYIEYKDLISKLKKDNMKLVTMYEFYNDNNKDRYIKTFYGVTENGSNSRNIDGMIKTFNEIAIPDMLVIANKINNKVLPTILKYIKEQSRFDSPMFYQWMSFVCEDFNMNDNSSVKFFNENSLSPIINKILSNKLKCFKEALLNNEKNIQIKYTNEDVNAMTDMIHYNEFVSLYADEIYGEKASDIKKKINDQNKSLYEEVTAMEDLSYLDDIDEAKIFDKHIQHKRTGSSPRYLSDIYKTSDTYEDDEPIQKSKNDYNMPTSDDSEEEPDIDSYRRPSASSPKPIKKASLPLSNDNNNSDSSGLDLKNSMNNNQNSNRNQPGSVYNTYYYNYTNSYNRNSNSYNKHRMDNKISDQSLNVNSDSNHNESVKNPLKDFEPWKLSTVLDDQVFTENIFLNENSNTCKLWHLPEKVSNEIKNMNTFLIKSIHNSIENGNYDEITKVKLERYYNLITSKGYLFEVGDTAILESKDNNITGKIIILPNVNEYFDFAKSYTSESFIGDKVKSSFNVTRYNMSDDSEIEFRKTLNSIIENAVNSYNDQTNSKDNNINLDIIKENYDINYVLGSLSHSYSKKILNYLREDENNTSLENDETQEVEDPEMPQSDHPVRDTLMDIDRNLLKYQQKLKKGTQNVINVGKAAAKPISRITDWLKGLVNYWKDSDEEKIKEDLSDPENRYNLYRAARTGIHYWALGYAGLLLNPIFLYLQASKLWNRTAKRDRIRQEIIAEIKTELAIIDDKIKVAGERNDLKNKYKLMRYRNSIEKKLFKVAGNLGTSGV